MWLIRDYLLHPKLVWWTLSTPDRLIMHLVLVALFTEFIHKWKIHVVVFMPPFEIYMRIVSHLSDLCHLAHWNLFLLHARLFLIATSNFSLANWTS